MISDSLVAVQDVVHDVNDKADDIVDDTDGPWSKITDGPLAHGQRCVCCLICLNDGCIVAHATRLMFKKRHCLFSKQKSSPT